MVEAKNKCDFIDCYNEWFLEVSDKRTSKEADKLSLSKRTFTARLCPHCLVEYAEHESWMDKRNA